MNAQHTVLFCFPHTSLGRDSREKEAHFDQFIPFWVDQNGNKVGLIPGWWNSNSVSYYSLETHIVLRIHFACGGVNWQDPHSFTFCTSSPQGTHMSLEMRKPTREVIVGRCLMGFGIQVLFPGSTASFIRLPRWLALSSSTSSYQREKLHRRFRTSTRASQGWGVYLERLEFKVNAVFGQNFGFCHRTCHEDRGIGVYYTPYELQLFTPTRSDR